MRELVISEQMRREGRSSDVLNVDLREEFSKKFHEQIKNKTPLGNLWSRLPNLRNDVDHAGWRTDCMQAQKILRQTKECLGFLEEYFSSLPLDTTGSRQEVEFQSERPDREPKVLLSALGMSPGLLYTAIKRVEPDFLLVLTSREAAASLDEILSRASYTGRHEVITVTDPHTGFDCAPEVLMETKQFLAALPRHHLFINLTGGTTCLQYIISRAGKTPPDSCAAVITVAMVDRRPAAEQRENQYALGEMVVVESKDMEVVF